MDAAMNSQRESMPLVECTSWCDTGDGHPDYFCREDQACWSPAEYVDSSLEEPHLDDGVIWPQRIGVMARRKPDQAGHVHVHLDGIKIHGPIPWPYNILDHGIDLTPEEAVRLGELLLVAAKLVQ